jgi:hypothetical protein
MSSTMSGVGREGGTPATGRRCGQTAYGRRRSKEPGGAGAGTTGTDWSRSGRMPRPALGARWAEGSAGLEQAASTADRDDERAGRSRSAPPTPRRLVAAARDLCRERGSSTGSARPRTTAHSANGACGSGWAAAGSCGRHLRRRLAGRCGRDAPGDEHRTGEGRPRTTGHAARRSPSREGPGVGGGSPGREEPLARSRACSTIFRARRLRVRRGSGARAG